MQLREGEVCLMKEWCVNQVEEFCEWETLNLDHLIVGRHHGNEYMCHSTCRYWVEGNACMNEWTMIYIFLLFSFHLILNLSSSETLRLASPPRLVWVWVLGDRTLICTFERETFQLYPVLSSCTIDHSF